MKTFDFVAEGPCTRIDGSGPTIVCLHSSGGSTQQWETLAQSLAADYRVVRADSHGHGRGPAPEPDAPVFAQDLRWLAPLVDASAEGVHLVGHSYGGALAVCLALAFPHRVRSLTVYEPVLFTLLDDDLAPAGAREEVGQVGRTIVDRVRKGQPQLAAQVFVDYWSGCGSWTRLGARQQQAIVERMPVVAGHFESIFTSAVTTATLQDVQVPTLILSGSRSPRAARAIVELLVSAWPHAEREHFVDLGHLGPITHPETVNPAITRFIDSAQAEVEVEVDPITASALAMTTGARAGQGAYTGALHNG